MASDMKHSNRSEVYSPSEDEETTPDSVVDWTKQEESKARRKLDFILLPVLALGYFCLHMFPYVFPRSEGRSSKSPQNSIEATSPMPSRTV